jgi:hypothetical protein
MDLPNPIKGIPLIGKKTVDDINEKGSKLLHK